jgi:polyferredoxin
MKMASLRLTVQHVAFAVFTYGGSFRISLGAFVPCLSCPFVYTCTGYCYLLMFQRSFGTLLMPFAAAYGMGDPWDAFWRLAGLFLLGFLSFSALVVLLGKTWCGWLCPFGLVQDWATRLRKALRIRESEIILRHKRQLSASKYVLLAAAAALPLLAGAGVLPQEFVLAFCNVCPAKALMPLFAGDARQLTLDMSTGAAFGFSLALLAATAATLVGMFFKDRFFCLFCPMLAFVNLYRRLFLLRITKEPAACQGCGNCRRTCSMDNETIYRERVSPAVYDADCMGCFKCAEGCAADGSLLVKLGPLRIFSSSRRYAAGK